MEEERTRSQSIQALVTQRDEALATMSSSCRKLQEQYQALAWERKGQDTALAEAREEVQARQRESAAYHNDITILQQEYQGAKSEVSHAQEMYEQLVSRYRQLKSEYTHSEGTRVCSVV